MAYFLAPLSLLERVDALMNQEGFSRERASQVV